jgi:hypothetical protein
MTPGNCQQNQGPAPGTADGPRLLWYKTGDRSGVPMGRITTLALAILLGICNARESPAMPLHYFPN